MAAPDTPSLEREGGETSKAPLENWKTPGNLEYKLGGVVSPPPPFFSLKVEGREKQGRLGRALLLPFPGVGWAVLCCSGCKGVFAPWFGVFHSRLLDSLLTRCLSVRSGATPCPSHSCSCKTSPGHLRGARDVLLGQTEVEGFALLFPEGAGLPHLFKSRAKQTLSWVISSIHHLCLLHIAEARKIQP